MITTVLAADEGGVAQGSPGTDVALGRPEGLLGSAAAALECDGTVVVLVLVLMLMLMLMLTPPVLRCALGEVCRSPRRRGGFQQGGRGLRFWEGRAHCCGSGVVCLGGLIVHIIRGFPSIVDPFQLSRSCPRELGQATFTVRQRGRSARRRRNRGAHTSLQSASPFH